jgi:2-hydroxychromene-2-carboxylate isomerase
MRGGLVWTCSASPTTSTHVFERSASPADVESADLSGVTGTPTFFVNSRRHYGPYDMASLAAAVRSAEAHSRLELLA